MNFPFYSQSVRRSAFAGVVAFATLIGFSTDVSAQDAPVPVDRAAVQPKATVEARSKDETRLRFNFRGASWETVLDWFLDEADLSGNFSQFPPGTVSFTDPTKSYSIAESMDLLNRMLMDDGFVMIRRGRMCFLVDQEAPNASKFLSAMAELVSVEDLESRGKSDVVSCLFSLGSITPDQAREQFPQMISPWGNAVVLESARQAKVTDTIERLLAIRNMVRDSSDEVVEVVLEHRSADELLELARPLLELEPGENVGDDIKISVSVYGDKLLATGTLAKLEMLQKIIKKADVPLETIASTDGAEVAKSEFKRYGIKTAEITAVFDVMQTMLQDYPDSRVAIDSTLRHAAIDSISASSRGNITDLVGAIEDRPKRLNLIQRIFGSRTGVGKNANSPTQIIQRIIALESLDQFFNLCDLVWSTANPEFARQGITVHDWAIATFVSNSKVLVDGQQSLCRIKTFQVHDS